MTVKTAADLATITTTGKVIITDTATVEQLATIDLATTATLVFTQVTDTVENIFTTTTAGVSGSVLNTDAAKHIKDAVNVTVTDATTVAQAKTIDDATTGKVTYSIEDSAANLAASGVTGNGAINVAVNGDGTATIAQAKSILALSNTGTTSYKIYGKLADLIKADAATLKGASEVIITENSSSADFAKLVSLVGKDVITEATKTLKDNVDNLLKDSDLGTMVKVEVNGGDMTIAKLTALDKANGGTAYEDDETVAGSVDITGGTIKDTAANLLKDANSYRG